MGSSLMSIGMRAMTASNAALDVTGHNIANANVEGYSRQQLALETAKGQFTGAGFFGKGVNVANVTRAHDDFLQMQVVVAKSLASMDSTRAGQLSQLEEIFPAGEEGLGYAMGDFFAAMADLANAPGDSSARQVVLARAADVAARFSTAAGRIDTLQAGVNADLQNSVESVNALAQNLAKVNDQIATYRGVRQLPNDLLDERDRLVEQLGGYLDVSTVQADDGSVSVFVAGGQRLVLGAQAARLTAMADSTDPSRMSLGMIDAGGVRELDADFVAGGSIGGLLKFQNDDLITARNRIGQMAAAFATRINEAQHLGLDIGDPASFGGDLFSIGAPQALPNANNARDGSGSFISTVDLTITDASLLQASEYDLRADPDNPGQYLVTRLSDGLTRSIASGDEIDGFQIDLPGGLEPGDRFQLQPVARAANGMARVLDDVTGIAAASPVTAEFDVDNSGTASLDSLKVVDSAIDPDLTTTITFNSDTGDYDWEMVDGSGTVVDSGSDTWTAGQPISLNGFELRLNGVPESGDSITVDKTQFPASNNGNALALGAIADEAFIGRTTRADGSIGGGETATDAYASAMADIGVRSQSAQIAAQISATAETQARSAKEAVSGVNLDEEAARLIQFQQSYQAAAKVLQVAQSVFDTMLQIGN